MIPCAAPYKFRRSQPTCKNGPDGQQDQRHGHHMRRLMDVSPRMLRHAALAVKHHEELTKHVKGGEPGGEPCREPKPSGAVRTGVGLPENLILGKEARRQRRAGNRQGSDQIGPVGSREIAPQSSHFSHVMFPLKAVDDAAGAPEEARLKKCVGKEMKDRRREGPYAYGEKHIAELAYG